MTPRSPYRCRHLRQPPGSTLCSQTALAIAAGTDLGRTVQLCGHEPLHPREMREAAMQLGLNPGRLRDGEHLEEVPGDGIWLVVVAKRHGRHAITVACGLVYDPGWPEPVSRKLYAWALRRNRTRVLCFFEVHRRGC